MRKSGRRTDRDRRFGAWSLPTASVCIIAHVGDFEPELTAWYAPGWSQTQVSGTLLQRPIGGWKRAMAASSAKAVAGLVEREFDDPEEALVALEAGSQLGAGPRSASRRRTRGKLFLGSPKVTLLGARAIAPKISRRLCRLRKRARGGSKGKLAGAVRPNPAHSGAGSTSAGLRQSR